MDHAASQTTAPVTFTTPQAMQCPTAQCRTTATGVCTETTTMVACFAFAVFPAYSMMLSLKYTRSTVLHYTASAPEEQMEAGSSLGCALSIAVPSQRTAISHSSAVHAGTGRAQSSTKHSLSRQAIRRSNLQCCSRQNVQSCDLVGLADLDTSSLKVQRQLAAYIQNLADLGVAGVRIDAAKHIAAPDLQAILAGVQRPELFVYQVLLLCCWWCC